MEFSIITMDVVLQGIFLGVLCAVLVVAYNKLVIGKFVKALIKSEAVHPAFAKTFDQLKIKRNFMFNYALRKRGMLRKVVFELDDVNKKGYYYIPEDRLYRAGRIYGGKDVDVLMVLAVIIVLFIFFAIVLLVMPSLMDMLPDIGKKVSK